MSTIESVTSSEALEEHRHLSSSIEHVFDIPQPEINKDAVFTEAVEEAHKEVDISKLKDDELIVIFSKLDGSSLISALETCQR